MVTFQTFLTFFAYLELFRIFGKFKNFGAPAPLLFVKRSCGDECDPRSSVFEPCGDECDPRSSVFEPCGDEAMFAKRGKRLFREIEVYGHGTIN